MAPLADLEGVWGKPTSTLDWCEENYVVTPYIAEFWNTVTNVAMIVPPILSLISLYLCNVEKRFYMSCLALLVVGLGSWCFHMTLLYEMQLLDEVPMIWGSCVFVYAFYESNSKPNSSNYILSMLLFLYAVAVTVIYIVSNVPIFHQVAYAVMVFALILRGCYCVFVNKQEYSPYLFVYSIFIYALGFFLWLLDNTICKQLREGRSLIPYPANAVLQFHGWWHVFAGLGSHGHIMFSCYLRNRHLKREVKLWRLFGILPFITVKGKEVGLLN